MSEADRFMLARIIFSLCFENPSDSREIGGGNEVAGSKATLL
jgi:hypothetical protein